MFSKAPEATIRHQNIYYNHISCCWKHARRFLAKNFNNKKILNIFLVSFHNQCFKQGHIINGIGIAKISYYADTSINRLNRDLDNSVDRVATAKKCDCI